MVRLRKLIRAEVQDAEAPAYQEGLQAMWEDRWSRLGCRGQIEWLRCHGAPPPTACPLLRQVLNKL